MKKQNEDMIYETEGTEEGIIVEKKVGPIGYIKDHWVPFLVGTVLVGVCAAVAGVCLGKGVGDSEETEGSTEIDDPEVVDEEVTI